jgi:hypothetical protein
MGPPSPPVALSATYLALLQARQAPQTPPRANTEPAQQGERPAPLASSQARGRLIDILA